MVAIFVDDGLVYSNRKETLEEILVYLTKEFEMRFVPAHRFIGLNITRERAQRRLFLSQPEFVDKILEKFGMKDCNSKSLPADPNTRLDSFQVPESYEDRKNMELIPYRQAVGALLYLTVMSRPDISYAVGQAAKYSENRGPAHWSAVKRILAYLAGTRNHGLCFKSNETSLIGYTDADYAGDRKNRRSTSGFLFFAFGGPVSWKSIQQSCTSPSTTEAEIVATCEATKEAVWLIRLVSELCKKSPVPVSHQCDNQSAIQLIRNPEFHQRTKHIETKYYFVREKQEEK